MAKLCALYGASAVEADNIAADAVITAKILDGNVTAGKLAANAVEKRANQSIGSTSTPKARARKRSAVTAPN
jgi:hypothetical protein